MPVRNEENGYRILHGKYRLSLLLCFFSRKLAMPWTASQRWLVGAALAVVTTGYGLYHHREQQMDKLYAEASGTLPAFRGTVEAQSAVKKLAAYNGDRSTVMLLNIALGRTPFTWPDVQREAMNALASRRDPKTSASLAIVLQPHIPLPTRHAAADALRNIQCTSDCVRSILHYLERVWQDEPNYEDRTTFPLGLNEGVKADLANEQEALYQTLYAVLKREPRSTMEVLYQITGLGQMLPRDSGSRWSLACSSAKLARRCCNQRTF
jgi:hypothetical protein